MANCIKCGTPIRYEMRRAGTKSSTTYYRTGVKSSWLIPAGYRNRNSNTKYESIAVCPNCGYIQKPSSAGGMLIAKFIGYFCLVAVLVAVVIAYPKYAIPIIAVAAVLFLAWKFRAQIKAMIGKRDGTAVDEYQPVSNVTSDFHTVEPNVSRASRTVIVPADADIHFKDAAYFVVRDNKATIGHIQRRLKIGFNQASRIMDQLADAGIVGAENGTNPREIYVTVADLDESFR